MSGKAPEPGFASNENENLETNASSSSEGAEASPIQPDETLLDLTGNPEAPQHPRSKKKSKTNQPPTTNKAKKSKRKVRNQLEADDYFGEQYCKTSDLPDPAENLKALATGVVEVIAGTRQIEQLARWLSDDVYQRLQTRARKAESQRAVQGVKARYQNLSIGGLRTSSPRDGVIESVVLLSTTNRTRAVTIRLEGINSRWRATSVSVL